MLDNRYLCLDIIEHKYYFIICFLLIVFISNLIIKLSKTGLLLNLSKLNRS